MHMIRLTAILLLLALSLVAYADKYAHFPDPQLDFQSHVAEVRTYLTETQMRQRKDSDVEYNLPFELLANQDVTYRGKFLLIHGLNDSPYVYTDVAKQLSLRGFDVRAILLPGHGNTPEAQLNMSYKRWLKAAREHLKFYNNDDKPIYLGGFSLGGVLATVLALENKHVEGLLLFSPAYKSSMNHLLRWSSIYAKFKPWVFGGMIIEDNPTKYNSIPINGAAQYYKTSKYLGSKWRNRALEMPVFMVASVDDSVVDIDHLRSVFANRFTSKQKTLILYTAEHDSIANVDLIQNENNHVRMRNSEFPEHRVINQSHQGVLMAPENPLFGADGSVLVCNGNDWPTFSGCLYSKQQHWFGAQHTPSPDGVPVARTTFNPDFAGMFEQFDLVFPPK